MIQSNSFRRGYVPGYWKFVVIYLIGVSSTCCLCERKEDVPRGGPDERARGRRTLSLRKQNRNPYVYFCGRVFSSALVEGDSYDQSQSCHRIEQSVQGTKAAEGWTVYTPLVRGLPGERVGRKQGIDCLLCLPKITKRPTTAVSSSVHDLAQLRRNGWQYAL